jgi:predicted RNA methylase
MSDARRLDQYYTSDAVAESCVDILRRLLPVLGYGQRVKFLEPSAGSGAFLKQLPSSAVGLDLDPKCRGVMTANFLEVKAQDIGIRDNDDVVVVGNPPFGRRAALAIEFFNHASTFSDTIAFIVPVLFRKWSVHRHLAPRFGLISDTSLESDAFVFDGRPYHVNCTFQVWTRRDSMLDSSRINAPPPSRHPDFEAWIYNNTRVAEKYFDQDFDFAVPRQGVVDYSRREADPSRCERTTHWMLFRAATDKVRQRLTSMDFEKLSKRNTIIPGFGKADVVHAYSELYESPNR